MLESTPHQIEVFDRNDRRAVLLKEDAYYYGTRSNCTFTIDLETAERRVFTKQDIARLAWFCNDLPNINFVISFEIANDTPHGANLIR